MIKDEVQVSNAYKAGMRRLAAGVSLITSLTGDQRVGLIATAVSSVIAEPPTLLVCINKIASAHDAIMSAGFFAVNVLAVGDHGLAKTFGDPSRRHERFQSGIWSTAETGAPILESAVVAFDCSIVQFIPYNTHTIFLGEVRVVRVSDAECHPLIYMDQQFKRLGAL